MDVLRRVHVRVNSSCQHCGYGKDADFNVSINISRMGVYSPHNPLN